MTHLTSSSIISLFFAYVSQTPDAPCVTWQGVTYSYNQLYEGATRVAAGLQDWGLAPGERVALALENSLEFIHAYLGIGLAGGVALPVNTQYRATELGHILSDAEVVLALCSGPAIAEVTSLRSHLPSLRAIVAVGEAPAETQPWQSLIGSRRDFPMPDAESLALLVYTSGTTGRAKGVMLTHANLAANIGGVSAAWRWTAADRLLLMLPLFHIHGLGVGLHGTLVNGGSLDLRPRFEATEALTALATGEYSLFFGVPTMYSRLMAAVRETPTRPRGVRLFVSGSAPLSPSLFAEVEREFGQPILERYGMTETGMLTTNPLDGERRPGAVGRPFPGQAVLVGSPAEPLPPGQVGVVWTRGPNVFGGYWRQPEVSAASFAGPWFNTGDMGVLDAEGVLTLVGRAKELIITGGFNVYPREVEDILVTHPGVAEVAVLGLPDADLGERVVAAVVAYDPAPAADELAEYCRARLAPYKKPRLVVFVDAIPRNALGKIRKDVLRDQLTASDKT